MGEEKLDLIELDYRANLKSSLISILNGNIVLYKPISKDIKYIGLIIVPHSLRCTIFSHYYTGPSEGYMGEYKALFFIRMRFFGPACVMISKSGYRSVITAVRTIFGEIEKVRHIFHG